MLYKKFFKRLFDLVVAVPAFLLLSPLFLLVAAMLAVANRGTPFFFQRRPGKNERVFRVIKFKTMNDRRDRMGDLLPDEDRITPVGGFVRKTSLDEIPQLLNVILGDMSLVGPRPLLVDYLPLYNAEQRRRHEVKPGITGWAQVNGYRGETRESDLMAKRVEYDLEYISNWTVMLDFKIIFMTAWNMLRGEKNAY